MLTITAPIQLNTNSDITATGEGFANRILSNYNQMTGMASNDELLHITTAPPEYYFGGSSSENIFNARTDISQTTVNNAEIITNLVNRILVEPEFGMTYQDKVYISSALRKYGIRNEQKFMNQVYALRQEVNQTRELIDIYWNNYMEINNLVEQYQESRTDVKEMTEVRNEEKAFNLHEEVMNRLQTAAIYQVVNNFNKSIYGSQDITNVEIGLSEQKRISEQIFLQRLKNEARNDMQPLIYQHQNIYEQEQFEETEVTEKNIEEMINSAVLLNLIDNIYEQRQNVDIHNENTWYDIDDSIYELTENTIERIRNRSEYTINNRQLSEEQLMIFNEINSQEIGILSEMINNADITEISAENITQNIISPAIERIIRQQTAPEEELTEQEFIAEPAEMELPESEEKTEEEEKSPLTIENNLQILQNRLNQMNQQNVDNYNLYQKTVREEISRVEKSEDRRTTAEKQKIDSLRALTNPAELVLESREKQDRDEEIKQEAREKALELVSPENKVIFNLIEQYLENPAKLAAMAQVQTGDLSMLVRDINRVDLITKENTEQITEREETVRQITNELTTEITHAAEQQSEARFEEMKNLSFTHRTVETSSIDEVTEQLIEQNRILSEKTVVNEQVNENREVHKTTNITENVQNMEEISRNVENLINQSITERVNTISDQVYRQMERRLESERRRRGL